MQRLAEDFGDAQVFRLYCDCCDAPLLVCYRGLAGDYCSRRCLERSDPERLKVKTQEASKVKTPPQEKVKTAALRKVKIVLAPLSTRRVKISGREERRIARRAAIRAIRAEILLNTLREPTVAEVQARLVPLGLGASVRTVWKDLKPSAQN